MRQLPNRVLTLVTQAISSLQHIHAQPKTVEVTVDMVEYNQHSLQNKSSKSKKMMRHVTLAETNIPTRSGKICVKDLRKWRMNSEGEHPFFEDFPSHYQVATGSQQAFSSAEHRATLRETARVCGENQRQIGTKGQRQGTRSVQNPVYIH